MFSARLGFSLRTYQKFEAGSVPQKATLSKLASAIGVSETALFLDPDLIPGGPPHSLEDCLRVVSEAALGTASERTPADPLMASLERTLPVLDKDDRLNIEGILKRIAKRAGAGKKSSAG